MLIAYKHVARSGAQHLRCKQTTYSDALKEKLRRVGSPANWIQVDQAWDYPLTARACVALDVAARDSGEQIEWRDGLKEFAEQHIQQDKLEHETRLAIERLIRDPSLPLEPYPCITVDPVTGESCPPTRYQQILYHWSQRVAGVLMFWSMGTGKTRGATDALGGWYRNGIINPMTPAFIDGKPGVQGGVLIICPKTMMRTWAVELAKWQNATGLIISGSSTKKMRLAGQPAHAHIINYENLKYVVGNNYDAVIPDELHKCSNSTQQTENTVILAQKAKKRLGLTGTLMTNSLEGVFWQSFIIDMGKSLGSSRTAFLEKYFHQEFVAGGFVKYIPQNESLEKVSAAMSVSTYVIKKEEVLSQLPAKTHNPINLEMTDDQARYYKQLKNELYIEIQDKTVTLEAAQAKMMKLAQLCQGFVLTDGGEGRHFNDIKTQTLVELLTEQLRDRKVVVWAQFTYEIQRIVAVLKEKQIPFSYIDGSVTSQKARDAMVDRWNRDPDLRVHIRQNSLSEGVTLHAKDCAVPCADMIYMGLNYRLTDWMQSQDRIHRIGQKYPCSYYYLLTEDGIDRKIYDSVLSKSDMAKALQEETKDYYLKLLRD